MVVGINTEVLYSDDFGYSKLGFGVFEVSWLINFAFN